MKMFSCEYSNAEINYIKIIEKKLHTVNGDRALFHMSKTAK